MRGNRSGGRQHSHPWHFYHSLYGDRPDIRFESTGDSNRAGAHGAHATIADHSFVRLANGSCESCPARIDRERTRARGARRRYAIVALWDAILHAGFAWILVAPLPSCCLQMLTPSSNTLPRRSSRARRQARLHTRVRSGRARFAECMMNVKRRLRFGRDESSSASSAPHSGTPGVRSGRPGGAERPDMQIVHVGHAPLIGQVGHHAEELTLAGTPSSDKCSESAAIPRCSLKSGDDQQTTIGLSGSSR